MRIATLSLQSGERKWKLDLGRYGQALSLLVIDNNCAGDRVTDTSVFVIDL